MVPQHLKIHWIEFPKSRLTLGIVNVIIVALNELTGRSKFSSVRSDEGHNVRKLY